MSARTHRTDIYATATTASTLTSWHYELGDGHSTVLLAGPATDQRRETLADVLVGAQQRCFADGRAALAATFSRLPGLSIATVPLADGQCLIGDCHGDTALAENIDTELGAVAAYLWSVSGRRLRRLDSVRRIQSRQPGLRTFQLSTTNVGQQLDRLTQIVPRPRGLVVAFSDLRQGDQHLGLIHR